MQFSPSNYARISSRLLTNFSKLAACSRNVEPRATVFLTHVKWVTGKSQLEKYFSRYGKVQDVILFFVSFNWYFLWMLFSYHRKCTNLWSWSLNFADQKKNGSCRLSYHRKIIIAFEIFWHILIMFRSLFVEFSTLFSIYNM